MSMRVGVRWGRYCVPRIPPVVTVPAGAAAKLESHGRLHLIRAPRGYGKTTISAYWAARPRRARSLWITTRRTETFEIVHQRIREAFDEANLSQMLSANGEGAPTRHRVLVVIDRADHLEPATLAATIRSLLDSGEQISVLATMRLGGEADSVRGFPEFAAEITPADLRFGPAEVRALAEGAGLSLSPADIDEIVAQTQGWPALVAAVVAGTYDGREPNWAAGAQFFDRAFSEHCTPAEKTRNLALSVTDHVTDAMAQHVLEDLYEPGYLARHDNDGGCPLLPVPALGEYRSSAFARGAATKILFRDAPAYHGRVHSGLSTWHEREHRFRLALWHAVVAADHRRIASVMAKHWPHLFLVCPDLLQIALNQLRSGHGDPPAVWSFLSQLAGPSRALDDAHSLLASTTLTAPSGRADDDGRWAEFYLEWGWAQLMYGMPTTALDAFSRARGTRDSTIDLESRVGISLCLGMLGHIKRSRDWAGSFENPGTPLLEAACALLRQIWRDDADPGLETGNGTHSHRRACAEAFVVNLIERVHPSAPEHLITAGVEAWSERDPSRVQRPAAEPIDEWERSTLSALNIPFTRTGFRAYEQPVRSDAWKFQQARVIRELVLEGKYGRVLALSSEAPIELRLAPRPWLSIILSRAIAMHRTAHPEGAGEALHQAVAVSQETSLLSPFSFLATHELREVARSVPQLRAMVSTEHIVDEAPSVLSGQQLLLLSELARGVPLKTIARRMHLSPSTVKSHLSRIYRELGVSDRNQAIAVAQERRLLMRDLRAEPSPRPAHAGYSSNTARSGA